MRAAIAVVHGRLELSLSEPDDLRKAAAYSELGPDEVDERLRLAGLGTCDEGHAWLSVKALRDAGPDDQAWRARFDQMVSFAHEHGWVVDGLVRLHWESQRA